MTKSGYYYMGDTSRGELCYDILENGFEIFIGESAKYPSYRQTEPFIPNPVMKKMQYYIAKGYL